MCLLGGRGYVVLAGLPSDYGNLVGLVSLSLLVPCLMLRR
jgi:hypothetical protein